MGARGARARHYTAQRGPTLCPPPAPARRGPALRQDGMAQCGPGPSRIWLVAEGVGATLFSASSAICLATTVVEELVK